MQLSIIVPVLDSHEILRRQLLHWEKINFPDDTEIIIVDDGSDPALSYQGKLPVTIIQTNDKRAWTWALARNKGVKASKGKYVLCYDIDHIIGQKALDICVNFDGDRVHFNRSFGVLTEDGELTQDRDVLEEYGLSKSQRLRIGALPNLFCMSRKRFDEQGGYREDLVERAYPQGEDRYFKKEMRLWDRKQGREIINKPAPIYMYPNGWFLGDVDADPKGLFHKLSRKSSRNMRYRRMK